MSTHHDRLAKCLLEETLDPVGETRRELEIEPGFLPRADFCFLPLRLPPEPTWPAHLRLLYRMVQCLCLFEFCTNLPDEDQVLDFHCKQMNLRNRRRQQGQGQTLPGLWILTCGHPASLFAALGVEPAPGWPRGFYRVGSWLKIGFVVLTELPRTRETLLLRLMGPPPVRDEALAEMQAVPEDDAERPALGELLAELRHAVERDRLIPEEDREEFMTAARADFEKFKTEVYNQGLDQGRDQGRDAVRAGLTMVYASRFGQVPKTLEQHLQDLRELAQLKALFPLFTTGTAEAIEDQVARLARS